MSDISANDALNLSFGEICDRGKVREENQDSVRNASIPIGELFIVADGIGGYQGGATASRMVVEGFYGHLASRPPGYPAANALMEACAVTNAAIFDRANSGDPAFQRMGSTVVLVILQPGANSGAEAWIGHVGDSRAYLIHQGQMHKITNDHSAVQALLNKGLITEEEARSHPDASVLTRSLGHRTDVEIEIDHVLLQPGDSLLLCSDGLWGYVHDADIATVATDPSLSAQTAARLLLDQALAAGGPDNIGIEFIRIEGNTDTILPSVARPSRAVAAPPPLAGLQGVPPPPSALKLPNETSNKARRLELIALALLAVGGSGYLVFAHRVGQWPFNTPKAPEVRSNDTVTPPGPKPPGNTTPPHGKPPGKPAERHPDAPHTSQPTAAPGAQHDNDQATLPTDHSQNQPATHRDNQPAVPSTPQPIPNQPAQGSPNQSHRKIVIAGEAPRGPVPEEITNHLLSIDYNNHPECTGLAKDRTVVYRRTAEGPNSPIEVFLKRRGYLDEHERNVEPITPQVSDGCGREYDVVIIPAHRAG